MAALDGKIAIGIDYRPCIVNILEISYKKWSGGKIEKVIKRRSETHKALFHCWSYRSEFCDASPMIGGHPGGQVSGTFAIVEYEDGTIREVEPTHIQFLDNLMSVYAFPEVEKKSDV